MRYLIGLITLAAVLWSGYWFVGSTTKRHVLASWLEERRESGWVAEYTDFDVVGFPNRFDSRFTEIRLGDPTSGIVWSAPFFNILALSYKPNHIITVWPPEQVLAFPNDKITIKSSKLQASVVFEPDTKLAVSQTALRSDSLALKGTAGWETSMSDLAFSTRVAGGDPLSHDVVFKANAVKPTDAFRQTLDRTGTLPSVIESLALDMTLGFNAPWDRIAIETGVPEVTVIKFNSVTATWGVLDLQATGRLDVAKNGTLSGKIDLDIKNWQRVLSLLVNSGLVDQQLAATMQQGLTFLTMMTGAPTTLKAPLSFSNGSWSIGPIPLGTAPRFVRE